MDKKEVGVITASSTSGSACVLKLLEDENGPKVRAIFRSEEKASSLRDAYASNERLRIVSGIDAEKPYKLGQCLGGCDVVFIITPYDPKRGFDRDALLTTRMIRSASEVGARHIILAGSFTACQKKCAKIEHISKRFVQPEEFLEEMQHSHGIQWTVLRGGFFHSNYSMFANDVKESNHIRFVDFVVPSNDPEDIGHAAAAIAKEVCTSGRDNRHSGKIYEISGPALNSLSDVTNTLSSVLKREITFENVGLEQAIEGLPSFLKQLVEYLVEHGKDAAPISSDVLDITGIPPIPLSAWIQKNRAIFEPSELDSS